MDSEIIARWQGDMHVYAWPASCWVRALHGSCRGLWTSLNIVVENMPRPRSESIPYWLYFTDTLMSMCRFFSSQHTNKIKQNLLTVWAFALQEINWWVAVVSWVSRPSHHQLEGPPWRLSISQTWVCWISKASWWWLSSLAQRQPWSNPRLTFPSQNNKQYDTLTCLVTEK